MDRDLLAPASALAAGGRLADYELEGQVGEGAYGRVYRGSRKSDKAKVALKRIRLDREKDGFPITAFREIRFLQRMQGHPNVVRLLDVVAETEKEGERDKGEGPGRRKGGWGEATWAASDIVSARRIYMVFELMEHDLAGLLSSRMAISAGQAQCYAHQLLRGLQHLQEHNVLHRDIKAANLLISRRNELKIADWGLSRSLFPEHLKSQRYTFPVVTLWYRAPELLLESTRYDTRIDMWSAGCVLLELVKRKPVFMGKSEAEQLEKLWDCFGTPDEESWPGVSDLRNWVDAVANKAKRPRRFRDLFLDDCRGKGLEKLYDLAASVLVLDPSKRPLASAAVALASRPGGLFAPEHPDRGLLPAARLRPEALPPLEMDSAYEFTIKKAKREGQVLPGGRRAPAARPRTPPDARAVDATGADLGRLTDHDLRRHFGNFGPVEHLERSAMFARIRFKRADSADRCLRAARQRPKGCELVVIRAGVAPPEDGILHLDARRPQDHRLERPADPRTERPADPRFDRAPSSYDRHFPAMPRPPPAPPAPSARAPPPAEGPWRAGGPPAKRPRLERGADRWPEGPPPPRRDWDQGAGPRERPREAPPRPFGGAEGPRPAARVVVVRPMRIEDMADLEGELGHFGRLRDLIFERHAREAVATFDKPEEARRAVDRMHGRLRFYGAAAPVEAFLLGGDRGGRGGAAGRR